MRLLLWLLPFSLFVTLAFAHIPDRPDLDHWIMGLRNQGNVPCCSQADTTPLQDAEWKVDKDGRYQVFIENKWYDVPPSAVLDIPNKSGRTLVWYIHTITSLQNGLPVGSVLIRCFLPAAGV